MIFLLDLPIIVKMEPELIWTRWIYVNRMYFLWYNIWLCLHHTSIRHEISVYFNKEKRLSITIIIHTFRGSISFSKDANSIDISGEECTCWVKQFIMTMNFYIIMNISCCNKERNSTSLWLSKADDDLPPRRSHVCINPSLLAPYTHWLSKLDISIYR